MMPETYLVAAETIWDEFPQTDKIFPAGERRRRAVGRPESPRGERARLCKEER